MAYDFTEDSKAVKEFGDRVPFGVSKVAILLATADETDAGKPFIEIDFQTAEGVEDKARVWFVSDANANISFNTLRQIIVHNAKDSEKDKARDAVDSIANTDDLAALINDKLIGGEMWVTKYYDPKRTYQDKSGNTKKSINTNMYGYEPKLRPDLMPQGQNEQVPGSAVENAFPGAERASGDAASGIPKGW